MESTLPSSSPVIATTPLQSPSPAKTVLRITVGPSSRIFEVDRGLLCKRSLFFEAALAERWQSSKSMDAFDLPDQDESPFEDFTDWMRTRRLPAANTHTKEPLWKELAQLYVLGDMLCITSLRNQIINDFVDKCAVKQKYIPAEVLDYIALNTTKDSSLRRLVADLYAWVFGTRTSTTLQQEYSQNWYYPKPILSELHQSLCLRAGGDVFARPPFEVDLCANYHEHDHLSPRLKSCRRGKRSSTGTFSTGKEKRTRLSDNSELRGHQDAVD
jgi:hypothetical protein